MSWLFGIRSNPPPTEDPTLGGMLPPPSEPPKDPKKTDSKSAESAYRFDSAALERAAQAAKDLEKSKHAGEVRFVQIKVFKMDTVM